MWCAPFPNTGKNGPSFTWDALSIYLEAFQGELKISIFWVFLGGGYLRWLSEIEIWKLEHTDSDDPSGCFQPSGQHRSQLTAGLSWPGKRPARPGKDLIITNWSHNRDPSLQDESEVAFTKQRSEGKFANPEMSQKGVHPAKDFAVLAF